MRLTKEQYKELMRRQPKPVTFFNRVSSIAINKEEDIIRIGKVIKNTDKEHGQLIQLVTETYIQE